MAQKKITELQLRDEVTSDLSIPSDDGIQSYRVTAAQMKSFILANQNILLAMLKDDIFHGLTGVSAADDDYFPLIDTSDSNKTKKALVSTFARNLYRAVSNPSDEAILSTDGTIKISGTTGAVVLPTAVGIAGKRYKFIHAGTSLTQVYTIKTTSSQTVGGIAGGSYALYTNNEVLEVESDGANWIILNHFAKTPWIDGGAIQIAATTTNPTKGNDPTVDKFWWRRDGTDLYGRLEFKNSTASGSAAGSGDYLFGAVPSGASIDTTKITAYSSVEGSGNFDNRNAVGTGTLGRVGTASGYFWVTVYDATYVRFFAGDFSSNAGVVNSAYWNLNNSAQHYAAYFTVPISGWQP